MPDHQDRETPAPEGEELVDGGPRSPREELPTERLLARGADALTDVELLSVLLGDDSALDLARDLLGDAGGLAALADRSASALRRSGIPEHELVPLLAALELALRLAREELPPREPLACMPQAVRYLRLRYGRRDQEVMGALYFDARNRLIRDHELYRGTLHRVAAEPREILKEALLCGAPNVIVFHTHPSGDPEPSAEDLRFTQRLADAGKIVGVKLLDHLILGNGSGWVSLYDRRAWS